MAVCISQFACLLVFFLAYLQLGTSLKCYTCKSTFNGDCDDVKGKHIAEETCENSKLVQAFPQAGAQYVCVLHRMVQKDEPTLSVVRGCAPENYCSSFDGSKECLTCATDLCNSSSLMVPSIIFCIISFIVAKCYL